MTRSFINIIVNNDLCIVSRHLIAVGSILARVTYETSKVLLAGGQVGFLGNLPFSRHLTIDSAQNKWTNLDGQ